MAISPERQRYLPRCRGGRARGSGQLARCAVPRTPGQRGAGLRGRAGDMAGAGRIRVGIAVIESTRGAGGIAPPGWGDPGGRARGRAGVGLARSVPLWLSAGTRRLGRGLGDRLFRGNDAEAFMWGWQTTRTSLGFGRRYRDQRFGRLAGRAL